MSRRWLSSLALLSIFATPLARGEVCDRAIEVVQECTKAKDEALAKHEADLAVTQSTYGSDRNTHNAGMMLERVYTDCAAVMGGVAAECTRKKNECANRCPPENKGIVDECKKKMEELIAPLLVKQQSCTSSARQSQQVASATAGTPTAPSPGEEEGGSDSLMPLLGGAALGGIAGYMLGSMGGDKDKDKDDKKDDDPIATGKGAEYSQPATDCSTSGAENKSECNPAMESICSVDSSSPQCQRFIARYCRSGSDTVQPASNMGEGQGSRFCNVVGFCSDASNSNCLTCIEAKRQQAATCQADPASCAGQYSQAEIETAKAACPVDPKFSDPTFAAGGDSSLPSVVLPQSVGRGPASDIEGRYGKSVFAISSGTFKRMCSQNRLKNCP